VISPKQRPLFEKKQHAKEADIHAAAGFESGYPGSEWAQTHALGRAVIISAIF
jgi:hypothetical protein